MASAAPAERALLALAAPLLVAAFAPAEGVAYRLRLSEQRITARGQTDFVSERRITFTRTRAGYRAEVAIGPSRAAGGPSADLFQRGIAGLAERVLVIHLDPAGAVTAIDDLPGHWRAYCDALAAAAAGAPLPAPAKALIDRLGQASAAEQRRTLGSLVTSVIAPEAPAPGTRDVRLPARDGPGALDGRQNVVADARGVTITTSAEGPLAIGGAEGRVAIEREERIERGLRVHVRETRRIWPKDSGADPSLTIVAQTALELAVK